MPTLGRVFQKCESDRLAKLDWRAEKEAAYIGGVFSIIAAIITGIFLLISNRNSSLQLTQTSIVILPANASWVQTDVFLNIGRTVYVTAQGLANAAGGYSGSNSTPDGYSVDGFNCDKGFAEYVTGKVFTIDCLLSGAPWGALIGRIDENPPFIVGASYRFVVQDPGSLYFAFNDCCDFDDNSGGYTVTVRLD